MEIKDLRKTLAGLCIAGLVSGAGPAFATGAADQQQESGRSG